MEVKVMNEGAGLQQDVSKSRLPQSGIGLVSVAQSKGTSFSRIGKSEDAKSCLHLNTFSPYDSAAKLEWMSQSEEEIRLTRYLIHSASSQTNQTKQKKKTWNCVGSRISWNFHNSWRSFSKRWQVFPHQSPLPWEVIQGSDIKLCSVVSDLFGFFFCLYWSSEWRSVEGRKRKIHEDPNENLLEFGKVWSSLPASQFISLRRRGRWNRSRTFWWLCRSVSNLCVFVWGWKPYLACVSHSVGAPKSLCAALRCSHCQGCVSYLCIFFF